jgi:hypothetical protein
MEKQKQKMFPLFHPEGNEATTIATTATTATSM